MRRRITILIAVAVTLAILFSLGGSGVRVPERAVLVLSLSGQMTEKPPTGWLEQLQTRGPALPTVLLQLEKAAADTRVEAVLLEIRGLSTGIAQMQELHEAVRALAERKPVVAWLDLASLNATRELYLASAARETYVSPGTLGPLAGIVGQTIFLKGFLDRIGVRVEAPHVGDYKSATEAFTRESSSPEARQQLEEMLDGVYDTLVDGLARGRSLEPDAVRALVDAAPGTAQELVDAGIADGIATREQVLERAGLDETEEIADARYLSVAPGELGLRTGPRIALIFAEGTIAPGSAGVVAGITPGRIGGAVETAAEDPSIRAIVLRINSGGGSSQASEAIWQKVAAAVEKKPVIVSMGDAAASGGYYVASAATQIVAQPTTLTGSIGVFLLRPSFAELFEKLEIRTEVLRRGRFAALGRTDAPLEPAELDRLGVLIRDQYTLFLERVARGRPLETAEVDAAGQGRVWLGSRAQELQLVDELGGLTRAVELAKTAADIAEDVDPERVVLPGPQDLAAQLRSLTGGQLLSRWIGLAARLALPAEQETGLAPGVQPGLPPLGLPPPGLPPLGLPEWAIGTAALAGEIVYLPPHWIELH